MRTIALVLALSGCSLYFGDDDGGGDDYKPLPDAGRLLDAPVIVDAGGFGTLMFQQGVNNYSDAHDTYLDKTSANTAHSTEARLLWRQNDMQVALIRFDGLFAPSRIPLGAKITSATLMFNVDASTTATMRDVIIPWTDITTYNSFGPAPGVDASDLGASVASLAINNGMATVTVTDSVARWSTAPNLNYGWIILATPTGAIAGSAISSDDPNLAARPRLVVSFTL